MNAIAAWTLLGAPWHIIQFYFAENTVTMSPTPVTGTSPTPSPLPNNIHEETNWFVWRANTATASDDHFDAPKSTLCQ